MFDHLPNEIYQAFGGTTRFVIDAPASFAGSAYLVLGSLSGTMPGFTVAGVGGVPITLPLNVDTHFVYTLNSPNIPPLIDTFGFLDAEGDAECFLALPGPLPSGWVGSVFNHAYFLLDPFGTPAFASNPVPTPIL